jgi:aspartate ammonia-lyase
MQAGSSIMPGKINPVIPEACAQAGMLVLGNHTTITMAVAGGNLELNQNMPLIAAMLLGSIDALTVAATMLGEKCMRGITVNEELIAREVAEANVGVTALTESLGYETATLIAVEMEKTGKGLRETVLEHKLLSAKEIDALLSPEAVTRLGTPYRQKRRSGNG